MVGSALEPKARASSTLALDPTSLSRMSIVALDELFATLEPASLTELQGRKRGRLLAVAGLDWMPAKARGALLGLATELPIVGGVWRGERFDGEFGANAWLAPGRGLEFARYLVREAPALDGGGVVIRLDYDVATNPVALRGILGELRRLGPGLFLARLYYRWGERAVKLLYFTLES
ncbi:hypothetical protein ENSA5_14580 [Enhygromyxa salina]|uniref:Uncharacterized protein n=1 Tax=Enhygromyxa salina TaxID=215803 RepID=A0A2S9YEN1_9BACT|nr:hypothetical protein [Enhygromyxa salina]PRQ03584.1 hypothetical protein ENSA5_14580 [Enhygromyxa salina]